MASYVAAYRIGMLVSTAGALFIVSGFERHRHHAQRRLDVGLCGDGGAGADRHASPRWPPPSPNNPLRAEAATRSESAFTRVLHAAIGAFSEFLTRKDAFAALAFVVLFKFTDAFSGTMTAPFVIDLGFHPQRLRRDRQGRRPCRNPDRRLRRRLRGAALFAGGEPVDRRRAAGGRQPVVLLAGAGRRQSMGAGVRDHGGEFHQRHRHRDLRRLSLGAVPATRCTPRPNMRCSPRWPRSGGPICRRARAMSRRRRAGRCSS